MGSVVGAVTGKGGASAAGSAAGVETEALQKAIKEIRRQFNITQENIDPFIEAGTAALPGFAASTTQAGLEGQLAQIFGGEGFQALRDERQTALQGQLAAGGLTRSGTALEEAANIPTQLGFDIENLLSGRTAALTGLGQESALGLGGIGAQSSGSIAGLLAQQGASQSAGITSAAQSRAAGAQNLLSTGLGVAGLFFSDPRLKKNVEKISEIHDLGLYEWDWIPETKGTMVEKCWDKGFMADEVLEKYPHHVSDYCGFMTIDYAGLLDELEAKNATFR